LRTLSFAQERLWVIERTAPGTAVYNVPVVLRLRGDLDEKALRRALDAVVARHEVLRTRLVAVDGRPVGLARPPGPADFESVETATADEALEAVRREAARPFDLERQDPFRARLFRVRPGAAGTEESFLLLNAHHTATDGWSVAVLFRELEAFYGSSLGGTPLDLPELPIQYADYASWQREYLSGPVLERQVSYWRGRLSGAPAFLEVAPDRPRPTVPTFKGDVVRSKLCGDLTRSLAELRTREGATLFTLVLAATAVLLGRHTGRDDVVIGTPVAGRTRPEVEKLIGFFANTLALRVDLSGDPTFRELLRRCSRTVAEALTYQEVPFEKLVGLLAPERGLGHHPLFQVAVSLESAPVPPKFPGCDSEVLPVHTGTSKFDLTFWVGEQPDGELESALEYSSELYERGTAERLLERLRVVLASAAGNPGRRFSELEIMPPAEKRLVVGEWASHPAGYPRDRTVPELFGEMAASRPHAVALEWDGGSMTYAELDRRTDDLAGVLRELGVGPEVLVAVSLERSWGMVASLLAVLKAGGAYVPLDPEYPAERVRFILEDSGARVLLTKKALLASLPTATEGIAVYCLDELPSGEWTGPRPESGAGAKGGSRPSGALHPDNLAYVMYTSGSTGRPKGVAIPHRAVVRLVRETNYARFSPGETLIQFSPAAFDASTFEIWGALLNGARLVLMPPGRYSVEFLGDTVRRYGVTTVFLTTALFNLIVDRQLEDFRSVRQLFFGGEAASVSHATRAARTLTDCCVANVYGPTENTTFSTYYPLDPDREPGTSVPIGRPISNTTVYVLDTDLNPVPVGVVGELYTGGDGLARGYHGRPDLTAERFVPDPFSSEPGARMYRTGDLVRWRPEGVIEFIGRTDHQVKIRGLRIELGEVEATLQAHPLVREAVVLARQDEAGEKRLVAYIVPTAAGREAGRAGLSGELRESLARTLPKWMVPSAFVAMDAFPLNPNGKVDRGALPAPGEDAGRMEETGAAGPRDGVELRLVELWEELLGRRPVGIRDNFFELGGHSLLAVRMVDRVRKMTGQAVPLAALFQTPTVENLAALIREGQRAVPYSPLAGLRASGSRRPVFCVHAAGGLAFYYTDVVRHLGSDLPVYGVQARGGYGEGGHLTDIGEMARLYVQAVRGLQPEGPYRLVGYCMGGVVAYEMAQQLVAQGHEVRPLVLINTTRPHEGLPVPQEPGWMLYAGELVNRGFEPEEFFGELAALEKKAALARLFERAQAAQALPPGLTDLGSFENWLELYRTNVQLYFGYRPQPYPGRLVVLAAEEQLWEEAQVPAPTWEGLAAGGVEVITVPGNHYTMVKEPHAAALAQQLSSLLAPTD